MENSTRYVIIIGAIVIVGLVVALSVTGMFGTTTEKTPNTQYPAEKYIGEPQQVILKVGGPDYILEPSVLKKGVPVRMTVDLASVDGCARDIVISEFGVRKYVKPGDNVIEFIPTKTGIINIACSMNMYRGTFTVSD